MPRQINVPESDRIKIAELFFVDQVKQSVIAKQFDVSVSTIVKYCQEYLEKYRQTRLENRDQIPVQLSFRNYKPVSDEVKTVGDVGPAFNWDYLNTIPHV